MYLLDTNTIVYYLNASLPPSAMVFITAELEKQSNISVITKIEALEYRFNSIYEQQKVEDFVDASVVLSISDKIVTANIALRRSRKIKLPNAIIASTALVYGYRLLSRNLTDFATINGLNFIDPYTL